VTKRGNVQPYAATVLLQDPKSAIQESLKIFAYLIVSTFQMRITSAKRSQKHLLNALKSRGRWYERQLPLPRSQQ